MWKAPHVQIVHKVELLLKMYFLLLQYNCCIRLNIRTERLAHIFTHYTRTSIEELRENVDVFCKRNKKWIEVIGQDVFQKLNIDAKDYVKELVQGLRGFDELGIVIACATFNIHCNILLNGDYFTTRRGNDYKDCIVKLAYIGDGIYKEIAPLQTQDEDNNDVEQDLEGTGLLDDDPDVSHSADEKDGEQFDSDYGEHSDEQNEDPNDSREHDFDNDSTSLDETQTQDVANGHDSPKPDQIPSTSNDAVNKDGNVEQAMDLTKDMYDVDPGYESHDSDLIITAVSIPDKPVPTIMGKVHRSRSYKCYLCGFKSEMQKTFVKHFSTDHPNDKFKCDFCTSKFDSCNGLFKHERSHQYLRYKCLFCGHRTQFPYQMEAHSKTHTKKDLEKCDLCDKYFTCKASKKSHQESHTTRIKCNQCTDGKDKIFTRMNFPTRCISEVNMGLAGCLHVVGSSNGNQSAPNTSCLNVQYARKNVRNPK